MVQHRKEEIIARIKQGEKLDKSKIYDLFGGDEEDVFLFWNGRKEEITNVALPFHSIEQIDEPRSEVSGDKKVLAVSVRQPLKLLSLSAFKTATGIDG